MQTHTVDIPVTSYQHDAVVSVVHLGDEHVGGDIDEELLRQWITRIAEDPNCYWVTTGDALDAIFRNDPRFEANKFPAWFTVSMLGNPAKYQIQHYTELFSPIAHQCLGTVAGNHEFSTSKAYERDLYTELWDAVGVPVVRRLYVGGFIRLRFTIKDKVIWRPVVFAHHGTANGGTPAAITNQLRLLPKSYVADAYLVGHAHKRVGFKDVQLQLDAHTDTILRRTVAYSCTGGFLRNVSTNGSYAERKLLNPQDIGPVVLHFYPWQRDISLVL